MARNYLEEGDEIAITAGAAYSAGDVNVTDGPYPGVMLQDVAIGGSGTLKINGVWSLPKLSTDTFAVGATVYWDASAKECTVTATSNTDIGKAFVAGASGDVKLAVLLNGLPD